MASTDLACLGTLNTSGTTTFGAWVGSSTSASFYPGTFNEFAFGENAPRELEISFYLGSTVNNGNRQIFNAFQVLETFFPGCRIRVVGNSNPLTFEFRFRLINNTTIVVNVPMTVTAFQWYHAIMRIERLASDSYVAAAYVGTHGRGVNGNPASVRVPFPYPNFAFQPLVGVSDASPFQDRSLKPFGKSNTTEQYSIGWGGQPSGATMANQLIGGIANFRIWSIERPNTNVDAGCSNFYVPETEPGLVHCFRFNETVTEASQFDDVGVKNGVITNVGGTPAGQFSGLAEHPFPPLSITYPRSVQDSITLSELPFVQGVYTRDPQDLIALQESRLISVNEDVQPLEFLTLSESVSTSGSTFARSVSDSISVFEERTYVHQQVQTISVDVGDSIHLTEVGDFDKTWDITTADTIAVSESVATVKIPGGGSGEDWNVVVAELNPDWWLKCDENFGIGGGQMVNSGFAGVIGDVTASNLTATLLDPLVEESTNSVQFATTAFGLANEELAWYLNPGAPQSFVMWVNIQTLGVVYYLVERLGNFFLNITDQNRLQLNIVQSPGTGALNTPIDSITTGVHMLSFSFDPSTVGRKLYIDGQPVVNQSAPGVTQFQNFRFTEFMRDAQTQTTGPASLQVDEIAMWGNRLLTDEEHERLYLAGTTPVGVGTPVSDTIAVQEAVVPVRLFSPATGTVSDTIALTETVVIDVTYNVSVSDTVALTEGELTGVGAPSDWNLARLFQTNPTLVPADQTDFPAYLDYQEDALRLTSQGGLVQSASGFDIVFASDITGSTRYDYELLSWNATTGQLYVWVKIPNLSSSVATEVYLLAGNPDITSDQTDGPGTFSNLDTNATDSIVVHLDDSDADGEFYDSYQRNPLDVTALYTSAGTLDLQAAQVRSGIKTVNSFGGISKTGTTGSPVWTNHFFTETPATLEVWFQLTGGAFGGERPLVAWFSGTTGRNASIMSKSQIVTAVWYDSSSVQQTLSFGVNLATDTNMHHYAMTWDGVDTIAIYLDGSLVTSTTTTMDSSFGEPNISACVAGRHDGNNSMPGLHDEARILDKALTGDWVTTEYNNQLDGTVDPGNFWGSVANVSAGDTYPLIVSDSLGVSESATYVHTHNLVALVRDTSRIVSDLVIGDGLVAVVNIWNIAMTALGISTISSTSEQSAQADLLNNVWADFRKQWLTQNHWNGAKTTASLSRFNDSDNTTNVSPVGRWSYAYILPDSTATFPYLHAMTINGRELQPDHRIFEIEVLANDVSTIRKCLVTDETTVKLEYLFDTKDVNIDLLAPAVQHAMGLALAAYIAPHFGKDQREIRDLDARAIEAAVQAKAIDGQEGSMRKFQSNPLTDVRR